MGGVGVWVKEMVEGEVVRLGGFEVEGEGLGDGLVVSEERKIMVLWVSKVRGVWVDGGNE